MKERRKQKERKRKVKEDFVGTGLHTHEFKHTVELFILILNHWKNKQNDISGIMNITSADEYFIKQNGKMDDYKH